MNQEPISRTIHKIHVIAAAQQIAGWCVALFFGVISIVGFYSSFVESHSDTTSFDIIMVSLCLVFTLLGVLLIVKGSSRNRLVGMYYDYRARLEYEPEIPIDQLADAIGEPLEETAEKLQKMIELGLFPNSFIDRSRNCVVTGAECGEPKA